MATTHSPRRLYDLTTPRLNVLLAALILSTAPSFAAPPSPPVEITTATYLGTPENDDLQAVAPAPDGSIYIVGNTGAPAKNLPNAITANQLAKSPASPRCGLGFVAHLSADGTRLLHYTEFAPGALFLTSVQVNPNGVYISGYASEALEPILQSKPGLLRKYPLTPAPPATPTTAPADGRRRRDPLDNRPGLGPFGAPAVLRLAPDLKTVSAGTYLEGWQQVWDKNRVAKISSSMLGGYHEYFWQPTSLALLKSGDLVVSHDGGYSRANTPADPKKIADKLAFYDVPDYASRLSPDLATRAWLTPVYTPSIDPKTAAEIWPDWPRPHFSNPRTHRLRLDSLEHIYLCGWSASATNAEPWWSPFLWQLDPATGKPIAKLYNYDPISGKDHRMNGTVADTACVTFNFDEDNNLLTSLLADGGNTVIGLSPKADGSRFEGPIKEQHNVKLVHWWGQISRVDAKTHAGIAGTHIGPWGWVTDLAPLPDHRILAVVRYNDRFTFTDDAWAKDSPKPNPNAFLRVYAPDFTLLFSTSLPGLVPYELTRLSPTRYALAARAEQPIALTSKNALMPNPQGKSDGYLLIIDYQPIPPATQPATAPN